MSLKKKTLEELRMIALRLHIPYLKTKSELIQAIQAVRGKQVPDNYGQAAGTINMKQRTRMKQRKRARLNVKRKYSRAEQLLL